jgi:hypothetical protein
MHRSATALLTAFLTVGATACVAAEPGSGDFEPETVEDLCADITARFAGDLFYDEDAEDGMAVLPDRLAALEHLREQAGEFESAAGEPAPEAWLASLDELIGTVDSIVNWSGGPGSDMILVMTWSMHENQVDELGALAADSGLGEECSDIEDWKFFPEADTDK